MLPSPITQPLSLQCSPTCPVSLEVMFATGTGVWAGGNPVCNVQVGEHGAALRPKGSHAALAPAAARGRGELALKPRVVQGTERYGHGSPQPSADPPPRSQLRSPHTGSPRSAHTDRRARRAGPAPGSAGGGAAGGTARQNLRPAPRCRRSPLPPSLFGAPFRPGSPCPVPTPLSALCLWLLPFPGLSCFCTDLRSDKLLKYLRRCPCGASVGFLGGGPPAL